MAKKSNIKKINIKIRNFFKGLPFEEGITTLDDERLIALLMLTNLEADSLDREAIIKLLRRAWSEGNVALRAEMTAFLTQEEKAHKRSIKANKVDTILELMEPLERTPHEENLLLEAFIDTKTSKLSHEKLATKLTYLRLQEQIATLEKSLGVTFNTLNKMEFMHSYTFSLKEVDFNKKLLTTTESVELESLLLDNKPIESILQTLKAESITQKEQEITDFTNLLVNHIYLDSSSIEASLKALPPTSKLEHCPISFESVESIIEAISEKYFLLESGNHFVVEKQKSVGLYGTTLYYNTSLSYEKNYLYSLLWQGQPLPIKEEFNEKNDALLAHFRASIDDLYAELEEISEKLNIEEETLQKFIVQFVEPHVASSQTLKIKDKVKRRILFHFSEHIKPLLAKQKREELLAGTIRDFKRLFPLARSLRRKIIFHVGPTNSGKTYTAMQALKEATTGYYLAPLRLLALEGYESLNSMGAVCSLITGEEELIDEDSTHISSTIEMMNSSIDVDVCVIDEIQMINDRDRGWAWANALIGAPAKTVILTGSEDALKAVTELCDYLEESLEVVYFERKNPLAMLPTHTPIKRVQAKTAIVAFSRKEVLSLKQQVSHKHSVSVIYGNLSPEVRREEARRFREGESDVLIATDAIAMGLNLPIKTLLFAKDNKFDGLRRRKLLPTEVKQISGRAGRYGLEEEGYIGALDATTLQTIDALLPQPLPNIELPVSIMASLEHVLLIGQILETQNVSEILDFFADNMEFDGPFVAANIDSMLEIAAIVDEYEIDLKSRYHLSCAPASTSSAYIENTFHRYIKQIEANKPVHYIAPKDLPAYAQTNELLLNAEDKVREISLYLWLSFKFPELFLDTKEALQARVRLNRFIETSLQKGNFTKQCRRCGKVLDFSYRFSICDGCHHKNKRGHTHTSKPKYNRGKKR